MAKIHNIAIIGAGAMGATYAAMFFDAGEFSVSFVARGEHCKRLKEGSLTVNGKSVKTGIV